MADRNVLDFKAQAEKMIRIIESKLALGQHQAALELLTLKFKALYEQGVIGGTQYEKEGIFPYTPFNS